MQHVYLVGAKGVSFYGGYESFVQKLLEYHKENNNIKYHVACKANGEGSMDVSKLSGASAVVDGRFTYCNADCFLVDVHEWMGPAQAIAYDMAALRECCRHIEENNIEHPIIYIMTCRVGPFFERYVKKIHRAGGKVYLNPDGHEWKRAKWSALVRIYWKESEKLMVKHADLVICDSKNIEKYIKEEYGKYNPQTTYIAYGSDTTPSILADDDKKYTDWLKEHSLRDKQFYCSVGRFVPENNFETMIREFMASKTDKDFAIITTKDDKYTEKLDKKLHFTQDKRIKFVGTVYDQELLKKIRENAYGYFHGHEVGGTNPSLLEALGATKLNLLYDVGFNREVAEDAALYWNKEEGSLSSLVNFAEQMSKDKIDQLGKKAKNRIKEAYSWELIADFYYNQFLNIN